AGVPGPAPEVEHLLRRDATLAQAASEPPHPCLRKILLGFPRERQSRIERAVIASRVLVEGSFHHRRRMFRRSRNRHDRIVWYPSTASVTPGTTTRMVSA